MERFIGFLKWCSYGLGFLSASLFLVWACAFVPPIATSEIFKSGHSFITLPLAMLIPAFYKANQQGSLFLLAICISVFAFCLSQVLNRLEIWSINKNEQNAKKRSFTQPSLIQQIKAYFIDLKRGKLKASKASGLMNVLKKSNQDFYYVLVSFPFQTNRAKGEIFFEYNFFEGKELASGANTLLVKFQSLAQAIAYAKNTSQRLKHTYAQMRPSEVKPVFKIGIHMEQDVPDSETLGNLLNFCQELCKSASPSQVISSNDVYTAIVENKKVKAPCTLIPLGFYRFESSPMQEVFEVE